MNRAQPSRLDEAIDCSPGEPERQHLLSREDAVLTRRKIANRSLDELTLRAIFATHFVVNIARTRHGKTMARHCAQISAPT